MVAGTKAVAGRIGELYVFGELLKRGLAVYQPVVDDGLDALVRLPAGQVIELQIQSAGSSGGKNPRWFQIPAFTPRPDFFIVGVEFRNGEVGDAWVFPSAIFYAYASGISRTIRDLDLDSGQRKHGEPLTDRLCGFRNRWELISDYAEWQDFMVSAQGLESLEDILAMKDAAESPEAERMHFDEYVRSQSKTL